MEIFKGFDKERLTKLPATELVAESDRPYLEKKIKTIFEHGEITFEANLIGKDGKPYPYFCNGILLKNDLDDPVGFTGTARNIAKLKEIEKNLRLSKERAEKATKEKDKFISLLSHDLRSPLGAINGLAGILLKPKEHNLKKEDSAEISQRIKGMADGLVNMIDRLLDISRLTIGTVKPVKKSYDLRIFAAIQIGRISHMLQNKEITISNEIPEHINVFFDDRLFGEVLLNVFSNAVKFSNRGGSISVRQCENISEEKITIAIEDSGVGINELRLKDIFKPEIKTNTLGTEGETGTGLGLPYCDDIMKAHKGNIRAESVEGKGSVFHIELPVSEMVIVIADDQEVQRDLLQTAILNKLNAEVLEASNGIEALKIVKETSPDLLITDIEMPEMDGFDLIREIRNNSETDGLPILVNSSLLDGAAGDKDSGEGIRAKVLKLGANAYFQKPFIPEELIAKINALL
jgi:PAS domain S-box-containing protein